MVHAPPLMLYRFHQWRHLHRLAQPLSKFTVSSPVSAVFNDEASVDATIAERSTNTTEEILQGLRSYGVHQYLSGSYFCHSIVWKLDVNTADQVVERLSFQWPELAVGFYNIMKRDHGFRHSRKCDFSVAHILARLLRVKDLQELIMGIIQDEGRESWDSDSGTKQSGSSTGLPLRWRIKDPTKTEEDSFLWVCATCNQGF